MRHCKVNNRREENLKENKTERKNFERKKYLTENQRKKIERKTKTNFRKKKKIGKKIEKGENI